MSVLFWRQEGKGKKDAPGHHHAKANMPGHTTNCTTKTTSIPHLSNSLHKHLRTRESLGAYAASQTGKKPEQARARIVQAGSGSVGRAGRYFGSVTSSWQCLTMSVTRGNCAMRSRRGGCVNGDEDAMGAVEE